MDNVTINNIYTFSRKRGEIIFVNFFDKVALLTIIISVSIYLAFIDSSALKASFFAVFTVIIFLIIFVRHFNNTAYKITLDLKSHIVKFYMFRNKGVISLDFNYIEKIRLGGDLTFFLKNGKVIIWKKRDNEEKLINLLKNITAVESGLF